VPFDVGVAAAKEVAELTPEGMTTAQAALRWILDQDGVSVVIPGARSAEQVRGNTWAAAVRPLPPEVLDGFARIYDTRIREHVHARW
jgi:aryl-alcohol dehydrogenase-like predicted oxidoreductase